MAKLITRKHCDEWLKDKTRNPLTGRKIANDGVIAKNLNEVCSGVIKKAKTKTKTKNNDFILRKHCDIWQKDKDHNPLTGRKIASDGLIARNLKEICSISAENCRVFQANPLLHPITKTKLAKGLFAQLEALCGLPLPLDSQKANQKANQKDKSDKYAKLINVLRKHIVPIIHKTDTSESRINFFKIINNYLKDLQPCLGLSANSIIIQNSKNQPIINFDKRIGTESKYGIAYLNKGAGFGRLLKFSCKLMIENIKHAYEVEILKAMTNIVLANKSIHFPIAYKTMKCDKPCIFQECPQIIEKAPYYIVINELADEDLEMWFKVKHSNSEYESIIMQIIVAIHYFNFLGYQHNDLHLGNFLIHKIKSGGYWHYKLDTFDIYIPNTGYMVVMWDFGKSTRPPYIIPSKDYYNTIGLIADMKKIYINDKLIPVPKSIMNSIMNPLVKHIYNLQETDDVILFIIKNIPFKNVLFKNKKLNVINKVPYKLN